MQDFQEKLLLLKNKVQALFSEPGLIKTPIEGLSVSLRTSPTCNQHCFCKPMAIVVLQGEKRATLGTEKFLYRENQLIVTAVDMPTVGSILQASSEKPFMTIILDLDSYVIGQLLSEEHFVPKEKRPHGMGMADADEMLLDAFYRLILLLDQPERQKVMAPMIKKELHYLLLTSSLGDILQSVHTKDSPDHQIVEALTWLKENFRASLTIEELAEKVHMAESSFYRHFKKVTSLSPLQYQKRLRLYEAQRLLLSGACDAAHAAYAVGYESTSQFTREYKRMFGASPKKNVNQIKKTD